MASKLASLLVILEGETSHKCVNHNTNMYKLIPIVKHFNKNNMMEKFQSAYRTHHSTEIALVRVFNDLTVNLDHCKRTRLALLDLSAAFDNIEHDKPLIYLSDYIGFGNNVLKFMKSYLSD